MESDEFIKKIRKFLDSKEVEIKDQYFVAKQLETELWDDIQSEGAGEEDEAEDTGFDESAYEEDMPEPPKVRTPKPKKTVVKKHRTKPEDDF